MNSFGRMFRVGLFGESHGPAVGVLIDGCPAGLPLVPEDFANDLDRRRPGARGTTARREPDEPALISGVFRGRTTGTPLLIQFENADRDSSSYDDVAVRPRPSQSDFVSGIKFGGFQDHRGAGHFSGRLTVGLVAAGVVAKTLIRPVTIAARLIEAGGDPAIDPAVEAALRDADSIGGIVECRGENVPAGLGEPFFDAAESLLAHIVMAVPGIRGIEFGTGFPAARMRGSEHNDPIVDVTGRTETNHAGGIVGGITNGNPLVFRAAVKPTPSLARARTSIDLRTGEQVLVAAVGRHDACLALRMPVIVEAAAAIVLADLMLLAQRVPRIMSLG